MPSSSRYLETEFEDARQREEYKRQRLKQTASQRSEERSDCENCLEECCGCGVCSFKILRYISNSCTCDSSLITMFAYIIFPVFAILDFVIGLAAKELGWYEKCVGQLVCDWSASACAVWIALALSAFLVALFAVVGKLVKTLCKCCKSENPQDDIEDEAAAYEVDDDVKSLRSVRSVKSVHSNATNSLSYVSHHNQPVAMVIVNGVPVAIQDKRRKESKASSAASYVVV